MHRRLFLLLLLALAAGAGACAPRGLVLPSGEGEAFPGYAQALQEATRGCRDVRSLSAELAISGRAGGLKLRGRVLAGLSAPGRLRLEGVAPFGPPAFILVADGPTATLLLPRDNRVLTGESAPAILDALVGLDLGPTDLLAILAGCVVPGATATGGRAYAAGWARVDLADGAAAYLQRDRAQRWRVRAGLRPPLRIDYEWTGGPVPATVRLQAGPDAAHDTDLRVGLSQVDLDVSLAADVFAVKVPAGAVPITLAELRRAGLVGASR
jgi:outer membrane lipoprotein-sorting protein